MKTREFPRGMTFIAMLAALLLAFPGVGLAGEGEKADEKKANQEYEPPTEEEQQEQEEAWPQEQEQEKERQTERERRQEEAREERAQQQRERQRATQTGQTAQVTLSVRTASAEELTNQPQQYFGELVQVSAQVEKKHGKHMLTLQPAEGEVRTDVPGRTATMQGDNLLVIIPREASADIPENEKLEIVGQVRPLLWTEFERDFAWFDMDLFQEFKSEVEQAETVRTDQPEMREETRPVLIATSIKTEDGKELLKEQGSERQRQPGEGDE